MKQKRQYTKENILEAVRDSFSISETCRKLGIKRPRGGSFELIKSRINEYQIDISHFLGKAAFAGKRNSNYSKRKKPTEVLIKGNIYRVKHRSLKNSLIEIGVEYKCVECGIIDWNGKSITLDVDHIDGDWSNCEKENLRFLCPNCHRQTDTFGSKNKKV